MPRGVERWPYEAKGNTKMIVLCIMLRLTSLHVACVMLGTTPHLPRSICYEQGMLQERDASRDESMQGS